MVAQSCRWVLETPRKILEMAILAENPDLQINQVRDYVKHIYANNHKLDGDKARPWGMVVGEAIPEDCLRWVFSRSTSSKSPGSLTLHPHKDHKCFVNKSGSINITDDLLTLKLLVKDFVHMQGRQNCGDETPSQTVAIQELLKKTYPGRHICIRGRS